MLLLLLLTAWSAAVVSDDSSGCRTVEQRRLGAAVPADNYFTGEYWFSTTADGTTWVPVGIQWVPVSIQQKPVIVSIDRVPVNTYRKPVTVSQDLATVCRGGTASVDNFALLTYRWRSSTSCSIVVVVYVVVDLVVVAAEVMAVLWYAFADNTASKLISLWMKKTLIIQTYFHFSTLKDILTFLGKVI